MTKAVKRIIPPKHKDEEKDEAIQQQQQQQQQQQVEVDAGIHGDVLEVMILTRLTLPDLVAASRVSKSWRGAVSTSLRISPRVKPWFILYALHYRKHSLSFACAFDPTSRVWLRLHNVQFPTTSSSSSSSSGILRSSHSQHLLYTISTTGFSFSFDPLHLTWHHVEAPLVWRDDPIVARLGSRVLVAGGTFLDDPLAVEMYDIASGRWDRCQSMPLLLKDSATSNWLSTAATDHKLYLLEKRSCLICSFDAETKTWGPTSDLNLISSSGPHNIDSPAAVFQSTIGFADDRLILVGLMGETGDLQGLGLWEVDQETYACRSIGEMPKEMVERLRSADSPLSTMRVSIESGFMYVYDPRNPQQIFLCELNLNEEGMCCQWGHVLNPVVNDWNRMHRFVYTCARVGMGDIDCAVNTGGRTFTVESDGDGLSSFYSFTVPCLV